MLESAKIRKTWLDGLKGIGILLMVVGHAEAPLVVRHWIYGFHMPLFFIIAGFLYDESKWKSRGWRSLIQSRASAYLQPYVFFFLVNMVFEILLEVLKGNLGELPRLTITFLCAGLYSHDTLMPNCAPLWFLTCIFMANILFSGIISRKRNVSRVVVAITYISILLVLCRIEEYLHISQLPWHIDVALIASVFMYIGYIFKTIIPQLDKIKRWKYFICISAFVLASICILLNGRIIMVINQYSNMSLFIFGATMISFAMIVFARAWKFSNWVGKVFAFWGRHTLVFVGFNYMVNTIVRNIYEVFTSDKGVGYCLVDTICVMGVCSILALGVEKYRKRNSMTYRGY